MLGLTQVVPQCVVQPVKAKAEAAKAMSKVFFMVGKKLDEVGGGDNGKNWRIFCSRGLAGKTSPTPNCRPFTMIRVTDSLSPPQNSMI